MNHQILALSQKNRQKYATITQHASGHEVCPVKAWAAIVSRILHYKGTNLSTEVDTVVNRNGKRAHIKADEVARHLKKVVTSVGKARLGFDATRVGTHSIRTSFAMMLYLQHIHPSPISWGVGVATHSCSTYAHRYNNSALA